MNKDSIRKILTICFIFLIILYIFLTIQSYFSEPAPIINVKSIETYLCTKESDDYVKIDKFHFEQDIYVCGEIELSRADAQKQLQLFIVHEGYKTYKDSDFYDQLWVSSGEFVIPISIYLDPGKYEIHFFSGRKLLSEIEIEIIN